MQVRLLLALVGMAALAACATQIEGSVEDDGQPPKIEYYADNSNKCQWRLISSNGNFIAKSSQGYRSRSACERSVQIVQRAAEADVVDNR